jgi:hypothetical protein
MWHNSHSGSAIHAMMIAFTAAAAAAAAAAGIFCDACHRHQHQCENNSVLL